MSPTVRYRYRNRVFPLGSFNHLQHLVFVVKVESRAALSFDEYGATTKHAGETLIEGAVELIDIGLLDTADGEVDSSCLGMDVHVRGTCQLQVWVCDPYYYCSNEHYQYMYTFRDLT